MQPLHSRALGKRGLWLGRIGEGGVEDLRLAAPGRVSNVILFDDGEVFFLKVGKLNRTKMDVSEPETFHIAADFSFDPGARRMAMLRQAWLLFRDYFADVTFNGNGWAELYESYAGFAAGARNNDEFMIVARMMLGELNASHINIWGDDDWPGDPVGDLGIDFDPVALARGQFIIREIITQGGGVSLKPGMELISLNGRALDGATNIHEILADNTEQDLPFSAHTDDGRDISGKTRVLSTDAVSQMRYENWVAENERLVARLSGGRFIYAHLQHIGTGATENLRKRLGASALKKQGLVLDIRNNGGGIESTLMTSFLARQATVRSPFQNQIFPESAIIHGIPILGIPVVLIQNEQTMSNAEIFSYHFRASKVGAVVSARTMGWVKGQRSYTLFDGSRVSIGAFDALSKDGESIDRFGREPDILIERKYDESITGKDSRIEAAVKALTRMQ